MAVEGTHLSRFFTCQPVCASARSCLQTGQYTTTTGVYRNGIPLAEDAVTLARVFAGLPDRLPEGRGVTGPVRPEEDPLAGQRLGQIDQDGVGLHAPHR